MAAAPFALQLELSLDLISRLPDSSRLQQESVIEGRKRSLALEFSIIAVSNRHQSDRSLVRCRLGSKKVSARSNPNQQRWQQHRGKHHEAASIQGSSTRRYGLDCTSISISCCCCSCPSKAASNTYPTSRIHNQPSYKSI